MHFPHYTFPTIGKFILSFLALVVLTAFLPDDSRAQSVNIFVASTDNASDDNPGTRKDPLKTIRAAIELANPGDRVIVQPGDYRSEDTGFGPGKIPVEVSGTESDPILIRGVDQPKVNGFVVRDVEHVMLDGFLVKDRDFDSTRFINMPSLIIDQPTSLLDGVDFTQPFSTRENLVNSVFSPYFTLIDDFNYSSGFDVQRSHNIRISDCRISGFWSGIQLRSCSEVKIVRNQITRTNNGIFVFSQDELPGATDCYIGFNRVSQCLSAGIDIRSNSSDILIESNSVQFSGLSHIRLGRGVKNSTVSRNIARRGGFYSETMEYPGSSGLNLHFAAEGNLLEHNFVSHQIDETGVDGNGIILDLMEGPQAIVRNNWSGSNSAAGIATTISPNAIIENNILAYNGFQNDTFRIGAGIRLARDEDINNQITGNLFLSNREAGIVGFRVIGQQLDIDRNIYFGGNSIGLIWDGFDTNDRNYRSIQEIRDTTGWEPGGVELGQ
jgi:hypothetical protein